MTQTKFILALAGLALAVQTISLDASAQSSARRKCRNRSSSTVEGVVVGGILGGVVGAIAGNGRGRNVAIGAGVGGVAGGAIADADGADACRQVDMDRADREEARRDEEVYRDDDRRGDRRDDGWERDRRGPRGPVVIPRYQFEQNFLRSYAQTYSDDQRLRMVADLAYDLQRRDEMIDGYELYQVLVRIDGGREQRLTANRADALRRLANDVSGLNYDERAWVDGLFPNKGHRLYPEVAHTIRRLSY